MPWQSQEPQTFLVATDAHNAVFRDSQDIATID